MRHPFATAAISALFTPSPSFCDNEPVSNPTGSTLLSWPRPPEQTAILPGCSLLLSPTTTDLGEGLLAGGAPFRVMRLSPLGLAFFKRWGAGATLGDEPGERALATQLVHAGILNPTWTTSQWSENAVTIVIPHFNRVEALAAILERVRTFSVIVVDDASDDPATVEQIVTRFGAHVLWRASRGGPGAARNDGLRVATTPFVAFIDTDCLPEGDWLNPLLCQMNDPLVCAVAPRIVGPDGSTQRERFEHDCSPLDLGTAPSIVRPQASVSFVPAATLLVRRTLGPTLFDPTLDGGEDVDLVWRMNELGWIVRYEPASVVHHAMRPTMRGWIDQRMFYGATAAPLATRHGRSAAPLGGSPVTLSAWALLGLGHPVGAGILFSVALEQLRARLSAVSDHPGPLAWRLTAKNLTSSGPLLARQVLRTYSPALLIGSLFSKRLRRLSLLSLLVAGIGRWREAESDLPLPSFIAWSTFDDCAYSIGVWNGALNERRPGALLPRVIHSHSLFRRRRQPAIPR